MLFMFFHFKLCSPQDMVLHHEDKSSLLLSGDIITLGDRGGVGGCFCIQNWGLRGFLIVLQGEWELVVQQARAEKPICWAFIKAVTQLSHVKVAFNLNVHVLSEMPCGYVWVIVCEFGFMLHLSPAVEGM